ncbi:toxin-antitoxin system YwqK family antitoxin [Pseudomonas sp. 6D_7.1_Bac1]|uniref:toxin-antitoxin system YwqK family antitoxin n=1 Tax=Pseudomonas sp. 6D_7.1_Bac1 TaxID=2971615 RepID=UPI0021C95F39|nr:toxin-antitoxin system YwqK family antitoxin [Pseudomonas sp. 6D_7.1_Bac1]MCU1748564.1 toxin-antitoxin system YwqK family antitoxin [Pseudomonas sp. 6D_7.1_Bac1]
MKYLSLLAISASLLSLTGCGSSELDFRNTQISNGKIYEGKENKPFTGLVTNMPESTIPMANSFNDLLVSYNEAMKKLKAAENLGYGRRLVCNSEVKDGYLSGQTICYKPNTSLKRYTAQYEAGNLDGEVTVYALDGATVLAKAGFKNNLRDGKTEIYGPNTGKLVGEYRYTNGKADGDQISWDENTGKMTYHVTAKDGSYVSPMKLWTPEGVLTAEVPFLNGMRTGLVKTWHENGKPMKFVTMVDGIRDGPSQEWDEAGKLISSGNYKREAWYPDEAPIAKESTMVSTEDNSCATKWIDAFHNENGEDAMITSDQLGEWDQWCTEGKLPN